MLKINNQSDICIIVVHEIYGINKHIKGVCEYLASQDFDVLCPNMLNVKEPFKYSQEADAYQYFISNVGFLKAAQQLKTTISALRKDYKKIFIVGFSVGATIAWLCSEEQNICDGIVGYYGSRIRDYLNVQPKCPVLLFFPDNEPSFAVNDLIEKLSQKSGVSIRQLPGGHGFSDPYSKNFCPQAQSLSYKEMLAFISKTSPLISAY